MAAKLDLEKSIEGIDFHLWRLKIKALLVHHGLEEAFGEVLSFHKWISSTMRATKIKVIISPTPTI